MTGLIDLLRRARSVMIVTHQGPDADGFGACLALGAALGQMNVPATVVLTDPAPAEFNATATGVAIAARPPDPPPDVVVVFDTGDLGRLGGTYDAALFARATVVNVDHHLSNTLFGAVNVVDPAAAAACEILYDLLIALDVAIDTRMAEWLLMGLVYDTQGFRTPSTTARTLRVAADLVERGASIADVADAVFHHRPLAWLKVVGLLAAHAQLTGTVLWAEVTPDLLALAGAESDDLNGVINQLFAVKGPSAVVLFRPSETGDHRVSARCRDPINVAGVCAAFGGGGHARAAGCTLSGPWPEQRDAFLAALNAHIEAATAIPAG
ncbi:MAG: DHH family phosphoesterase [Chloroflexi bacterium]|nr:DHH family phosphoesterase [Chloroflexota bacterium]